MRSIPTFSRAPRVVFMAAACWLAASAALPTAALAQKRVTPIAEARIDASRLEGVSLKIGPNSVLVLANAAIEKSATPSRAGERTAAQTPDSPTLLKRIGNFEVHTAQATAAAKAQAAGRSLPAFADAPRNADFVGAAYLADGGDIALISKEIIVTFKDATLPAGFDNLGLQEFIKGSGQYLMNVADIFEWIKVVSRLQADQRVAKVEPQLISRFATPQ